MVHAAFRRLAAGLLTLLLLAAAPAALLAQTAPDTERPTNVILLIPDGYGPASATMARDFLRAQHGITSLALDSLQTGSVRTFSASSRVTDSAAGATAYATGHKTYNGAIAVDTSRQPMATLLEAAEQNGMTTGLVATSRITHATPAAFAAHIGDRDKENEIAEQELNAGVEVMLGGGRRHFVPESGGGERTDGRNLIDEARQDGHRVVQDRQALMATTSTPVLGLFADSHMAYEIDRAETDQPSLADMTRKAIELLENGDNGYFLMVEGSRIDHAGHANDPAAHLRDILAFNEASQVALEAARENENTLVLSVSDHETGGMTLGRNIDGDGIYAWKPGVVADVEASFGAIYNAVQADTANAVQIVREMTGVTDLTDAEQQSIRDHLSGYYAFNGVLSDIVSRRALVGWTTNGHTAVDVSVFAFGPGHHRFTGNRDNTYIGQTLADLLGFDLDAMTTAMREGETGGASTSR